MFFLQFRTKYCGSFESLISSAESDPSDDLSVQLGKIGTALFTDRYCCDLDDDVSSEKQRYMVAPYMFKHLVGKNHREFSSGRQQDASEYFQYLLDSIEKSERSNSSRLLEPSSAPTSQLFQFEYEKRLQCELTGQVRYISGRETLGNILELQIPMELSVPKALDVEEKEQKRLKTSGNLRGVVALYCLTCTCVHLDADSQRTDMEVPFGACLEKTFSSEIVQITNSSIADNNGLVNALLTTKFKFFPRYLVVKLNRYYVDSEWKQKKIDAAVKMPEFLDLSHLLSPGLQSGEALLPTSETNSASVPNDEASIAIAQAAEDELTMQLVSMGFSENGCRRAVRNTGGSGANVEVAMNWVLEHMCDPDFDAPLEPLGSTNKKSMEYDMEAVSMLMSFGGFSENRVKKALRETDGNSERLIMFISLYAHNILITFLYSAADWLFSHVGEEDNEVWHQNILNHRCLLGGMRSNRMWQPLARTQVLTVRYCPEMENTNFLL